MTKILSPHQICKSGSEHAHQSALFCWLNMAFKCGFDLAFEESTYANVEAVKYKAKPIEDQFLRELIFAIPNGAVLGDDKKTRAIRGNHLKSEGLRSGVADIAVMIPTEDSHGLFIEMKKPKKGVQSDKQKKFQTACDLAGYRYVICMDWFHAASEIKCQIVLKIV